MRRSDSEEAGGTTPAAAVEEGAPATAPALDRRKFLGGVGGATLAGVAGGLTGLTTLSGVTATDGVAAADEIGPDNFAQRKFKAYQFRQHAALQEFLKPVPFHIPCNGDEDAYANKIGSYSKSLPHDPLTGVLNRRAFEEEIERAVRRAHDRGERAAVFFLDLDQFKLINDSCGHFAGDELLKLTVERLQPWLPHGSPFARIGGDEFAALAFDAGPERALAVATALKQALEQSRFSWEDRVFEISASVGVLVK